MHSTFDWIEHGTLINVSHFARFAKGESLEEIMSKRGRPRKSGQLVRMLKRDTLGSDLQDRTSSSLARRQ
jgi:hypothetical protein